MRELERHEIHRPDSGHAQLRTKSGKPNPRRRALKERMHSNGIRTEFEDRSNKFEDTGKTSVSGFE
jgi:hypothetical protein